MAAGGKSIVESVASTPFDNAFTSGTGSDGSYLCVTNHNLINSGSTGSNALTTPLSAEGLEAAYILGRNVVDDANVIIRTQYDTLLIPEDLERKAEELMMSVLNPETGNNAINVYKGKIKNIVVCPYLSSASAWFLIDSSSQRRPKFFWRLKPEFHVVTHPTSLNALMIARERFSTIFAGWQGVIGSTGAA